MPIDEAKASLKDGMHLTNKPNAVERTIIVVTAYGIAILTTILLRLSGYHPFGLILVACAIPLAIGASSLGLKGGLILALATTLIGLPFLLTGNQGTPGFLLTFLATNLALGGGIGLVNNAREARRGKWQRAKSLDRDYSSEIFDNSLNMIHFIDKDGNILKRNEISRDTLGYKPKGSLQFAKYMHPGDVSSMKVELARLFERGEVRDVKVRFISQKRTVIPVEIRATRATQRVAVVEACDLRQQVELERRLMETEALYRYLIEDAIDTLDSGIIITDRKRQVVWANKTIERFFGVDRDGLIGIDGLRALSRYANVFEDSEDIQQAVKEAFEKGGKIDSYTCHVRPGPKRKERSLEYRSIPIATKRYTGGRIDHYIDITRIKHLEKGLREKTKRLEQSNEKLEEFSHVVSHDLKEPLRTVEAFSGFVLEDYADQLDEEGVGYLKTLKKSSARMRALINDLLKLSSVHMDTNSFERVNIQRLLEETKQDLEVRLQGVNLQIADNLPTVLGSKTRIGELFSNLIVNAIKYNDKALPTVRIGYLEESENRGMNTFFVQDNGIGIESRYQERIFGIFEKLNPKEDQEGTGAGLAICKRIVEEHKGKIWVTSEVGKGTTFYFTIPKTTARREVKINA